MRLFLDVFSKLNENDVKYVVVGGLAVVLHGHPRLTVDVDLVVGLDEENARKTIVTLTSMGYRPRTPVDPEQFASHEARTEWTTARNMIVFSLVEPNNPFHSVDLFVDPPIPFEELIDRSVLRKVGDVPVRVCSLQDLIAMKRASGRPQDLADIKALEEGSRDR